jgi:putative transposase
MVPGLPQHVIQRGNNRSPCFAAASDYRFYLDCLETACERHDCRVHAYVLMTNHVHLLVTPSTELAVARVMQSVGRRYVQRFNATYQRTGTLWEGRYRATLVEADRYLLACHRYIELNPVRARLARQPLEYPWSSHRANAFGDRDRLVSPHAEYDRLGHNRVTRHAAYRNLFGDVLTDDDLAAIRDATNRGWVLGGDRFREEVATLLERRTEPSWVPKRWRAHLDGGPRVAKLTPLAATD